MVFQVFCEIKFVAAAKGCRHWVQGWQGKPVVGIYRPLARALHFPSVKLCSV